MRKIEAFVRHFKLDDLREALVREGVTGMTVTEVHGFGRQKGRLASFRGVEYEIDFVPKIKIEMVLADELAASVVTTILQRARTGEVGDGKVFVTSVLDAIRIRTGEQGALALK
mgnify:CR=1 FL=1